MTKAASRGRPPRTVFTRHLTASTVTAVHRKASSHGPRPLEAESTPRGARTLRPESGRFRAQVDVPRGTSRTASRGDTDHGTQVGLLLHPCGHEDRTGHRMRLSRAQSTRESDSSNAQLLPRPPKSVRHRSDESGWALPGRPARPRIRPLLAAEGLEAVGRPSTRPADFGG